MKVKRMIADCVQSWQVLSVWSLCDAEGQKSQTSVKDIPSFHTSLSESLVS